MTNEELIGLDRSLWRIEKQLDAKDAEIARLRGALKEFDDLIRESRGIADLHLNGEVAEWDWLMENEWLETYAALAQQGESDE